jgi:sulfonate transport system substrate-binding protein
MERTGDFVGDQGQLATDITPVLGGLRKLLCGAFFLATIGATGSAAALSPKPEPLPQPVKITVGFGKVAHLSPIGEIAQRLKELNVEMQPVEFIRYADIRTAIATGSLDIATIGPADLPILLSQNITNIVGLMGAGESPKFVVTRNGVDIKKWEDLKGKRIGVAPASAVWFQFAAMLKEVGVPYNSFTEVKIQGAAPNAVAALKRGEVDAIVTWEPFESQPVAESFGYWPAGLDYSKSKAVGAELGLIVATREALNSKREAVRRFLWAYLEAVDRLNGSQDEFAKAIAKFQGIDVDVANRMAKNIKLGNFFTLDQMQRQTKAFFELGVFQKDVSAQLPNAYDEELYKSVAGK